MRSQVICGLLVLTVLAGCGGDDDSTGADRPTPEERLAKKAPEVVDTARIICKAAPSRSKFADDFNMSTTDPAALAKRFARGYDASVREQVEVACLKGLVNKPE